LNFDHTPPPKKKQKKKKEEEKITLLNPRICNGDTKKYANIMVH